MVQRSEIEVGRDEIAPALGDALALVEKRSGESRYDVGGDLIGEAGDQIEGMIPG